LSVCGVAWRIVSPTRKSSKNRPAAVLAATAPVMAALKYVRVDVIDDDPLEQHDAEQEDDRRDIDAPGVGQKIADRAQERFGQGKKQIPNRTYDFVADIDDAERDQPGQNGAGDDDPGVKIEGDHDDVEDSAHEFS